MSDILIAADQGWHSDLFLARKPGDSNKWSYVSNQKELETKLNSISPRYIFFLHWSEIIPESIWNRFECVCFHMTDLPFGRGGSPLQNLIMRGVQQTKLTAFKIEKELDAGPIYTKRDLSLDGNAEEIYLKAASLSWDIIQWIVDNKPSPVPQKGFVEKFTRRTPKQSVIPSFFKLRNIYDHIRMLDAPSYPKAYIEYGELLLEFSKAQFDGEDLTASVKFHKNLRDLDGK